MYRNESKRESFVPCLFFVCCCFGFLGSFSDHNHGCSMAVLRVITVTYTSLLMLQDNVASSRYLMSEYDTRDQGIKIPFKNLYLNKKDIQTRIWFS